MRLDYFYGFPCVGCGMCCSKRPCPFGEETAPGNPACRFSVRSNSDSDDHPRYRCSIHDEIAKHKHSRIAPAFGAGCCQPMFNEDREAIISDLRRANRRGTKTLGLVGSIGAGKSLVAGRFQELGSSVFKADDCVHWLLTQKDVIAAIVGVFGDGILDDHGRVDRRGLAAGAFKDEQSLRSLESILFPRVRGQWWQWQAATLVLQIHPILVLDAPLLFEAGWQEEPDLLLVVDAPRERRSRWVVENRGWNEDELARRERRLIPVDQKIASADYLIDNVGSKEELLAKADQMWAKLTQN